MSPLPAPPAFLLRLQGWLWQHSELWRGPGRKLRAWARRWSNRERRAEVVHSAADPAGAADTVAVAHPAIEIYRLPGTDAVTIERFLAGQTESSVATIEEVPGTFATTAHEEVLGTFATTAHEEVPGTFAIALGGALEHLPPTHLESLLMIAAAGDLPVAGGGWAPLGDQRPGDDPRGARRPRRAAGVPEAAHLLLRAPRARAGPETAPDVIGRLIAHPSESSSALADGDALLANAPRAGRDVLHEARADAGRSSPRVAWHRLDEILADLPTRPGPPTCLFLLPYLAVGGAERQLLDVLDRLGDQHRALVVTLEPHRAVLGQTLDAVRARTPHVYPLGDWLPRPAHDGAVRHLLRRWRVETLVSWNGTVLFYDRAGDWRRDFPRLRILNQVYNHRGGWIARYGPRLRRSVDLHLAINGRIAQALARRGVDAERIETVLPAARVMAPVEPAARAAARQARRAELGLPSDALVIGTFIRMHPQKRPLDVVALARRFAAREERGERDAGVHFLLVGGGPLDRRVDAAIAARPLPNLTRLGLRHDVEALYDALDLCLMTSAFEGVPIFLLDGLARGLPAIATAVGDIPLLLDEESRGGGELIARPGDLEAFERAIERLRDPERRAAAGARGRAAVAERFELGALCNRYRELIFPPASEAR